MDTLCKCGRTFPTIQGRSAHIRLYSPPCRQTAAEGRALRRDTKRAKDRARGIPQRVQRTPEQRFWSFVDMTGDCWVWTGYRYPSGYGQFGLHPGDPWRAHRYAWVLANGPIPEGMFVCHRCDNPPCVRPDHLFLGTADDNTADMDSKGRRRSGITRAGNRGWSYRNRDRVVGAGNPSARLTQAQAAEIRTRRVSGELLSVLAAEFSISETTVSRIARGKSWR